MYEHFHKLQYPASYHSASLHLNPVHVKDYFFMSLCEHGILLCEKATSSLWYLLLLAYRNRNILLFELTSASFPPTLTTAVYYHSIKGKFPGYQFILPWGHLNFQTLNRNRTVKRMSLAHTRPKWDLILRGHGLPGGWRRWPLLP